MPLYFAPTAIPMKNCAAQMISAGGRAVMMPDSDRIAVRIIGPRIVAPKSPIRAAIRQPRKHEPTISAICTESVSRALAPGGNDRSTFHSIDITSGATVTITRTREAWISDSARMSPPASSPNTSMSCSPPGIAPNHAVAWSKPKTWRNSG